MLAKRTEDTSGTAALGLVIIPGGRVEFPEMANLILSRPWKKDTKLMFPFPLPQGLWESLGLAWPPTIAFTRIFFFYSLPNHCMYCDLDKQSTSICNACMYIYVYMFVYMYVLCMCVSSTYTYHLYLSPI